MALIKCEECRHDVSTKADKCPNCGAPVKYKEANESQPIKSVNTKKESKEPLQNLLGKSKKSKEESSIAGWIFGIIFLVFGLLVLFTGSIITALMYVLASFFLLPTIRRMFHSDNIQLKTSHRIIIVVLLFTAASFFINTDSDNKSNKTKKSDSSSSKYVKQQNKKNIKERKKTQLETAKTLNYKIVKKETLKKGGQLNPPAPPKYNLVRTYAALQKEGELTEENIKTTLKKIISEIRMSDNPDAIVVYLHQSKSHIKGSLPFARAEWWPKGHSLSPNNAINIKNKKTYEIEYTINLPKKVDENKVVVRLSELKRKEIFTEIVKSQDKAQTEAEAKYTTDQSKIPLNQLRSYDFATAIEQNNEEYDRLAKKYKKQLLHKYNITEEELYKIKSEAFKENWPFP